MRGRRITYSADELAFVKALAAVPRELIVAELAEVFGRTDLTMDNVRQLCIRQGWVTREKWTAAEDAVLRERFPNESTERIAKDLGRSLTTTYQRAYRLGLEKSAEYLASPAAGRLQRNDTRGAKSRFQKGHIPANKGVKRGKGWAPGRMAATQFRKGTAPHTWMPVGSTRVIGGYEYTKVSDVRNVPYTVNWKPTHQLQWEAVHGPMPAGHALKCLDGNRLNTAASNWACIPRAVLSRLNGGPHKKRIAFDAAPAELKPTMLAVAKLEHAMRQRRSVRA